MPAHTPIFEHCVFVLLCGSWRSVEVASQPDLPPSAWRGTRLTALCMVLGLVVFLAVSAPHAVHHLFEQQHTDCLVFSLTRSTPVTEGALCLLPAPLPCGDQPVVARPRGTIAAPRRIAQPRAPPA